MKIVEKLLRAGEGRILKKLDNIAAQVNAIEEDFEKLTDAELRAETDVFKKRLADGETLDDILPEAFAAVREASKRTLGKRHFDVQIMGGAALHMGNVAEMRTGEGKTLVATLPAYLNALTGKGVHVVTVNDYLAEYQSELMGRVHRFLGLETGCILASMTPEQRRAEYAKDITYGTNNEFGFDYLRDNMAWSTEELVQREPQLRDRRRGRLDPHRRGPHAADHLRPGRPADQVVHRVRQDGRPPRARRARERPRRLRGRREEAHRRRARARHREGRGPPRHREPLRVGQHPAHRLPQQRHQGQGAVPARQGLRRDQRRGAHRRRAHRAHAGRPPLQRGHAPGHRGQGGGADPEREPDPRDDHPAELLPHVRQALRHDRYGHDRGLRAATRSTSWAWCRSRPTAPMVRMDQADLVYRTEESKYKAVVADIVERHAEGPAGARRHRLGREVASTSPTSCAATGSPTRCSTPSTTSARPRSSRMPAARARSPSPRTWPAAAPTSCSAATPSSGPSQPSRSAGSTRTRRPEEYEAAWDEALATAEAAVAAEHDEVTELGGLYVLGTERHESRRIDNQLRGRSGRQGDPGESRFYLSLEDHLMRLFNADLVDRVMTTAKLEDDQPIESKMVSRSIQSAQAQVEAQNFEIRKNVLKYDDVLNRQRTVIYEERRRVLEGEDLHEQLRFFVNDVIEGYVDAETSDGFPEDWNLERLWTALRGLYPVTLDAEQVVDAAGGRGSLTNAKLKEEILSDAHHAYDQREEALGSEVMREVERRVMLSVLDRKWREHLYEMDYLQEGIGLRAMAQRDPLVEYQREGFALWTTMNEAVREESVGLLFHVDVSVDQPAEEAPAIEPVHVSQMLGAMSGAGAATADGADGGRRAPRASPPPWVPASAVRLRSATVRRKVAVSGVGVGRPRTGAAALHRAERDRRGRRARRGCPGIRHRPHRGAAGQHPEERPVPLRLGQEVQDVPRAPLQRSPRPWEAPTRIRSAAGPPSIPSAEGSPPSTRPGGRALTPAG